MFCTSCGQACPAGARFCGACGTALQGGPAVDTARKTVTVVFADLVGSTALGEQLDPEALRAVQGRYFDTLRNVLARHGATVEKFIGDAVMAIFGVPAVREDDALRALRAALEMQPALARLEAELNLPPGERLRIRIGINTGEVVVGGAGATADQRLATGDVVNVAARLQQAAPPGETFIGEVTRQVVRDAAVVQALPPLAAKGKREPLRAWRLLSVASDAPAIARTSGTPFVGRGADLLSLQQQFERVGHERHCRLVTVIGTPGTGKSRLAAEFARDIAAGGARVLEGRCAAYGEGVAYLPLAEVVRALAGDSPEVSLASLLQGHPRGELAAGLIVDAVRGQGTARSPEETAWAFRRLFETLAAECPLLLVIDDIHWADAALLDLVEYVVGFSTGVPLMVLCLARPELLDIRPAWAALHLRGLLLPLQSLSDDDAGRLIDGLRRDAPLPPAMRRRIVATAEGNPLFVEQMLAMVAEQPQGAVDRVPPNIHALLSARLDRLPAAERAVLQRASVQGRLFRRAAVAALLGPAATGLGAALLALTRKEFLRPDAGPAAGDDGFQFNHALIRDVAYASLTKEMRAHFHVETAAWLERHEAPTARRDEVLGHHLEQAWDCRQALGLADAETAAIGRRAGMLLATAGRRTLDRSEAAAASALLARAARLPADAGAARVALLQELAHAQRLAGALESAVQTAQQAEDEARATGDELGEQRARIAGLHAQTARTRVAPESLREAARAAIAVFERHASHADLADAWQLMGSAELVAGDRRAQLEALQRGRAHAIESGNLRRQIQAWNEVGGAMLFGRTPVAEVLAFLDEELAWAAEHGLAAVEADALLGGPYLLSRLGRFDEARERLARSKALWRELGMRYELSEAHVAGAQMEQLAGDPAAAERELRDAIAFVAQMKATRYEALYRSRLAHVLIDLGRSAEARAELEALRGPAGDTAAWKMAMARLLAREDGRGADAVALAREALAPLAASDDLTARAHLQAQLAEVLHATGDAASAADAMQQAVALHEAKGNLLPAAQCRARLAALVAA